jgi:hypothetical protein
MLAPAYFAAMIIVVSAVWVGRKRPLTNMSLLGRISIYVIFMLSALQAIPAVVSAVAERFRDKDRLTSDLSRK